MQDIDEIPEEEWEETFDPGKGGCGFLGFFVSHRWKYADMRNNDNIRTSKWCRDCGLLKVLKNGN